MTRAQKNTQPLRAALRHPDAVGTQALNAWANRIPVAQNAPLPATMRTTFAIGMVKPMSAGANAASHDEALRAHRPGARARMAARYSDDTAPWGGWKPMR